MEPDNPVVASAHTQQLTQDLAGLNLLDIDGFGAGDLVRELDESGVADQAATTHCEHIGADQGQSSNHVLPAQAAIRGLGVPRELIPNSSAPPGPSVVTDLGYGLQRTELKSSNSSAKSSARRLRGGLDDARVPSAVCSHRRFLPTLQLPKHINNVTVKAELRRHERSLYKLITTGNLRPPTSDDDLAEVVQKICGTGHQNWRSHPQHEGEPHREIPEKTYRKVLAILLLIREPREIRAFLREEVCDADLPLACTRSSDLCRRKAPTEPLALFTNPRDRKNNCILFFDHQWIVLAPFFGYDERRQALFFTIPDQAILPFTKWEKVDSRGRLMGRGGHGQVYKTEIHPDHHGFADDSYAPTTAPRFFAVKQLRAKEKDFRHEFTILRKVSRINHPHIITLFAAYEHLGLYHFIFPWAPADLMTYWQDNAPINDADTARWIAVQCEGLAGGLAMIHRSFTLSPNALRNLGIVGPATPPTPNAAQAAGNDATGHRRQVLHCRHGDIKRENILWFPGEPGQDGTPLGRGTLKLTDFGAAELLAQHEVPWTKVVTSPIYRPPEADKVLSDSVIGVSYDIWSLGCLYLDFAAWCFGGWDGVERFMNMRYMPEFMAPKFHVGTFFHVVKDEGGVNRARVKPGVHEFVEELRSDPACSDFFRDFLGMICDGMLLVEQERGLRRNTAAHVAYQISLMLNKGELGHRYFGTQSSR